MNRPSDREGFTVIELLVVIAILTVLLALLLPAVQQVRAAAARLQCQNNLKQIGLALHSYHDTNNGLPPGLSLNADRQRYPYLGWTARILPFIEQNAIWDRAEQAFRSDPNPLQFYGHAPHHDLLGQVVPTFGCPSDSRTGNAVKKGPLSYAFTTYLGVAGRDYRTRDGLFFLDSSVRLEHIADGTSNTLMVGERPPPPDMTLGWWYRGWGQNKDGSAEMLMGVRELNTLGSRFPCSPGPYDYSPGLLNNPCDLFHFWSLHSGGALFALADGSVRFFPYSAQPIMASLASRAGGEAVSLP